jgi:glutamate racemase
MTRRTVAFLDSGIGGLPYLARTRELAPAARCVYLADRENFPYGGKPRRRITAAVESAARRLIEAEDPALIVVACNTASVVALERLRASFPIPFVGVVPAVKPAAAASKDRHVGVLATQRTVEGKYLRGLVARFAEGCTVVSLPAAGLVDFVERALPGSSRGERLARVEQEAARFTGIDTLVLGCTHFLHLRDEFQEVLAARGITLIDSLEGVARQAVRLLAAQEAAPQAAAPIAGAGAAGGALFVTGREPVEERYRAWASRFGLEFGGILP